MNDLVAVSKNEIKQIKTNIMCAKRWCDTHTAKEAPDVLAIPLYEALNSMQSMLDKATHVSGEAVYQTRELKCTAEWKETFKEVYEMFKESGEREVRILYTTPQPAPDTVPVDRFNTLLVAVKELLFESEEYDFNDGLGQGALQQYWDNLQIAYDNVVGEQHYANDE